MKISRSITLLILIVLTSCGRNSYKQIVTTDTAPWCEIKSKPASDSVLTLSYDISLENKRQTVEGFGACFNELGWTSLSILSTSDRESIMKELFKPGIGANFNICRMPIAANDFALDWYSYNEVKDDFNMENFSIDNDKETLIPFIHAAKANNPNIKIWASPWSPPTWMKYNNHYAQKYNGNRPNKAYHNGLLIDKQGFEGEDMFIQEPKYMEAYALYFEKFIKAYREENIDIYAVMPQNEFNSNQIFPSCCWKSASLATFMGKFLGPKMDKLGVDLFFGTVERANAALVDTILTNVDCKRYVKGVGFQWAGKGAVGKVSESYPNIRLYQSEQECGNGKNDWMGVDHSWELLKHYFDNGVSAYMYWNISLLEGGISRWGWAQNSLVVVDPTNRSYKYTHEYYLMKHISHFVKPGARYVAVSEDFKGLVFENLNGEVVVLYME